MSSFDQSCLTSSGFQCCFDHERPWKWYLLLSSRLNKGPRNDLSSKNCEAYWPKAVRPVSEEVIDRNSFTDLWILGFCLVIRLPLWFALGRFQLLGLRAWAKPSKRDPFWPSSFPQSRPFPSLWTFSGRLLKQQKFSFNRYRNSLVNVLLRSALPTWRRS